MVFVKLLGRNMLFYCALGILNQAIKKKLLFINIPYTEQGYYLIKLLYKLGYIKMYKIVSCNIYIVFKWYKNEFILNRLFFYSKPGYIKTVAYKDLIKFKKKKNGLLILLNDLGICTSEDAIKSRKGGILIARIE